MLPLFSNPPMTYYLTPSKSQPPYMFYKTLRALDPVYLSGSITTSPLLLTVLQLASMLLLPQKLYIFCSSA